MKTHVRALVVGGGAVGAGIAYHLAKRGWDTLLLERDELTSGSTWHAAGLLPLFNMSYATSHIHDYSVKFYKTLEEETGLNAGFSSSATCAWPRAGADGRIHALRLHRRDGGHPLRMADPAEIKGALAAGPHRGSEGAIYHPTDGYINPADVTRRWPRARGSGVTIERRWQVDAYRWTGINGS
jgi:dimethylglycine dehydrogenase